MRPSRGPSTAVRRARRILAEAGATCTVARFHSGAIGLEIHIPGRPFGLFAIPGGLPIDGALAVLLLAAQAETTAASRGAAASEGGRDDDAIGSALDRVLGVRLSKDLRVLSQAILAH